jgi:hypothetical protein
MKDKRRSFVFLNRNYILLVRMYSMFVVDLIKCEVYYVVALPLLSWHWKTNTITHIWCLLMSSFDLIYRIFTSISIFFSFSFFLSPSLFVCLAYQTFIVFTWIWRKLTMTIAKHNQLVFYEWMKDFLVLMMWSYLPSLSLSLSLF